MNKRSRVIGDFKLRKTLRAIHKTAPNILRPALEQGAQKILSDMKALIPKDEGDGSAALTAFVAKSGLDAQVGIRGKKKNEEFFYLRFVEYGTKGYKGESYTRAGRLRRRSSKTKFARGTGISLGKYPDIPARRAQPFLRPAYDMNREEIRVLLSQAIRETLRRAAK